MKQTKTFERFNSLMLFLAAPLMIKDDKFDEAMRIKMEEILETQRPFWESVVANGIQKSKKDSDMTNEQFTKLIETLQSNKKESFFSSDAFKASCLAVTIAVFLFGWLQFDLRNLNSEFKTLNDKVSANHIELLKAINQGKP